MELDDLTTPPSAARRSSSRIKKIGAKVSEALLDPNSRLQALQARLDALENDNVIVEAPEPEDDDEFTAEEEAFGTKKTPKGSKRKTRQSIALEKLGNAKKGPRTFIEFLQEANLEALPPHVPSYLRAAVGPPSRASRRHFCAVCGYLANYTCPKCGVRFCSCHCQTVHNETRCQKFVL